MSFGDVEKLVFTEHAASGGVERIALRVVTRGIGVVGQYLLCADGADSTAVIAISAAGYQIVKLFFTLIHKIQILDFYLSISGRNELMIRTTIPDMSTATVRDEQPRHSFNIIPQTFENTTLRAIRIHQLKVISDSESVRKPLPRLSPKNWIYHSTPAKAQKSRLLVQSEEFE